jgi:hypothetical protein
MNHYTVDKEFRDFADDVEAVNLHYLCTPIGVEPDWESNRATRYMPLVEPGGRRLRLELPAQVIDSRTGRPTTRYSLLHYFEIFRGGDRQYSQIYTEVINTSVKASGARSASTSRTRSTSGRVCR